MAGIRTSSYPIKKVGDSPYPYPYPVNAGILHQNGNRFGQLTGLFVISSMKQQVL